MNQEKIGKFIAKSRKVKNMTQSDLAEKLGVTDKSISNWENGRNMPDLSLFKPLCDELGITINDLLSGEKISKDKLSKEEGEERRLLVAQIFMHEKTQSCILRIGCLCCAALAQSCRRDSVPSGL